MSTIKLTVEQLVNTLGVTKVEAQKMIKAQESKPNTKTPKQLEVERLRLEKISLKESYNGFMTIYNLIRKESKIFTFLKPKAFEMYGLLGSMNLNEFVNQFKKIGRYSFDNVWGYAQKFDEANDGDKQLIINRGLKINSLLMELRKKLNELCDVEGFDFENQENKEKINALYVWAVDEFLTIQGLPFRTNSKKEKVSTVSKGCAKWLFINYSEMYKSLDLENFLPKFHAEFIAVEVVGVEA